MVLMSYVYVRKDLSHIGNPVEQALLKAGFIPQVHAHEVRLRQPARRTLSSATRPFARRLPLPNLPVAA